MEQGRYTGPRPSIADFPRVGIRLDEGGEVEFQRVEDGVLVSVKHRHGELVGGRLLEPQRLKVLVAALSAMLDAVSDMPAASKEEGRFGLLELD